MKTFLFSLVAMLIVTITGCVATNPQIPPTRPSRQARYEACLNEERTKAVVAHEIAPIYGQEAKQVASPNIERCSVFLSRGPVPVRPYGSGGRQGYPGGVHPQPGRGYYSTEDCGQWRQHGLEEACSREQSRDGSHQRNGAFDLGRNGADCRRLGVADLREECFRGQKMTRDREAKRYYNYTR